MRDREVRWEPEHTASRGWRRGQRTTLEELVLTFRLVEAGSLIHFCYENYPRLAGLHPSFDSPVFTSILP